MIIKEYPDGGKYVINDLNEINLTYRINTYEDLFLLKSIKDSNPSLKEITIPCMFQQQHDRRFNQNESFELKLVCDYINSCNFQKVKIFHPHSDVTPALLNNCEVINNTLFIESVIYDIRKNHSKSDGKSIDETLILMSSDAGGFKPLVRLCKELDWQGEIYSASKARDNNKLVQMIDRGDFFGKDILIIDDILCGGNTFLGIANILQNKNIGNLFLAVSHITISNPNEHLAKYYKKIYSTNSKNLTYNLSNLEIKNLF